MDPVMDAKKKCRQDVFNPMSSMGTQMASILVLGHCFHLLLKPIGQSGPVAQLLAGILLGPSALSNIPFIHGFFFQYSSADYYIVLSMLFRILFMFLIGLDMDTSYLLRSFRLARTIAMGGIIACSLFGAAASLIMIQMLNIGNNRFNFVMFVMLVLSSTASPVVIRLAAELKFTTSNLGRLAISSALLTDLSCLMIFALITAFSSFGDFGKGIASLALLVIAIFANNFLARWLNTRNQDQKYLSNPQVLLVMCIIVGTGILTETMNYNSGITCFLLGVTFPREGKTARTLLHKLKRAVHDFILPLYFGYIGFQFDVKNLSNVENIILTSLVVVLSIGGKIGGTLVACHLLKIPLNEGVILAFFMNLKGHAEIVLLTLVGTQIGLEHGVRALVLIAIVFNTLIAGPVVAFLLRRGGTCFAHTITALEIQDAEEELRMLACVYGPRHVSSTFGFISALCGSQTTPTTPYLMHLVELPEKINKTNLSYHEVEGEFSDDDDYGGNDVVEINNAVDAFAKDTGILLRQIKVVSPLGSLYEDVCNGAEDLRTSILLLPFHKHQRIDGTMVHSKEGIRNINQKVIRHCPCSVGIIVDRGLIRVPHLLVCENPQHVATLFFGGHDDREALAWSQRMATHPKINLTLIRFLHISTDRKQASNGEFRKDHNVLMDVRSNEPESETDNVLVSDFFSRFVTTGKVGYVEKFVTNGEETVAALNDLGDMYSLLIVGKGGRGHSHITTGLSNWEECPELGTVGDLLASSDVNISSSVLVIQQHRSAATRLNGLSS